MKSAHSAIGLYLWMWAIFTGYMFIGSLRTTAAVAGVFLLLTITFVLLGIGNSALSGTLSTTKRDDQARWLVRSGHGDRRLVRIVRRGRELDLRPHDRTGGPTAALAVVA